MAATIIGTINQLIKDGEDPESYLRQLPISQITWDNAEALIGHFLQTALGSDNVIAARTVINVFDELRAHIDPLPVLTYLFLNCSIDQPILKFIVNVFSEKEAFQYYVDLVNMPDDVRSLQVVANLIKILPELSYDDWSLLYRLTEDTEDEEYPNQNLRAFFQTKINEVEQKISPPSWVIDTPQIVLPALPSNIPSVKEAVDLLITDMKNRMSATDKDGESIDIQHGLQIREALISQYAISTINEKIKMVSGVKSLEDFDSTSFFREFGPINTMYSVSTFHDPTHECTKYGGCAMLLCTEFEELDGDGDNLDLMTIEEHLDDIDWFRGSCDKCYKKIPFRHYAIRFPLQHGGWRGCYCSFDCMNHLIENEQIALTIQRMHEQLTTIGIRDR